MSKKFTRSEIRAILGDAHTDEIENALMALHLGVVDPLKEERDRYQADADKLPDIQKQLDGLKNGEDFKAKYEKEHSDFEAYKTQVAKEAETAKVKAAYRKLLQDEKINDKRLDVVMRSTDFSSMKLDGDGNLVDVDALKKTINKDWADFKVTQKQRGLQTPTPPSGDNGGAGDIRQMVAKWHADRFGSAQNSEQKG